MKEDTPKMAQEPQNKEVKTHRKCNQKALNQLWNLTEWHKIKDQKGK
jgi:hypothetical protein